MSNSFSCPKCENEGTRVRDSRPRSEGGVRRRRHCPACDYRFTTVELEPSGLEAAVAQARNVDAILTRQAEELVARLAELPIDDRLLLLSVARRLQSGNLARPIRDIGRAAA